MKKNLKTKSAHIFFDNKFKDKEFAKIYEEVAPLMDVALEISKARDEVGLSQADLARRLNTSQSVISRIENGNQNLSVRMLAKIGRVMGLSLSFKFERDEDERYDWDLINSHFPMEENATFSRDSSNTSQSSCSKPMEIQ